MANIQPYIDQILNAVYGEEVRSSIVNALEKVNDDNNSYADLKKEVIADEAVLIAECGMEEIYLTVFEELNFINRSGGKVSMAAVRKNNLENSPAFRQAEETGRKIYRQYRANMLASPQVIAGGHGN
mgnify:CR=1 FL=1